MGHSTRNRLLLNFRNGVSWNNEYFTTQEEAVIPETLSAIQVWRKVSPTQTVK